MFQKPIFARVAGFSFFVRQAGAGALLVFTAACTATPTPTLPPTPNIIISTPTAASSLTAPAPTPEATATTAGPFTLGAIGTEAAWRNSVRQVAENFGARLLEAPAATDAANLLAQGAQVLLLDEAASSQALALAQANPNIFIIAVSEQTVAEAPSNLLSLGGPSSRQDQAGFLAGMLAGYATNLERVAVVSDPTLTADKKYRNGFTAGVRYVCPKCQTDLVDLPATTDAATVSGEMLKFVALGVDVFWVAPGGYAEAALGALATKRVSVIAGRAPQAGENFLASVNFELVGALSAAIQSYQAAQNPSGQQALSLANGGIRFTLHADPNGLLSPLDIKDIEAGRDKLASGALETGVDPLTGDEK